MRPGWLRFAMMTALLAGTGAFLYARSQPERIPLRKPVASFPVQFNGWEGHDISIDQATRDILGDGEFAERGFARAGEPPMDVFLAYFPTQRTGSTIHSPKNCLPGSGWTPIEDARIPLRDSHGHTVLVNRYIVAKGLDRQLVLYWYQAHGRIVASEYWAKIYMTTDAISMNRSDGSLVRLVTPLPRGEELAMAEKRAINFAQSLMPTLDEYIPR